ncbi:ferritin-like domain-containing protein [Actinomadura chibensis]|uniref:DNA protection protein DPS n=1 Tax=Actinomadura chibensis TaxID=392828 RepID=A0A5D0NYY8_9ACTN|nr:ferritin-like domain-containing protein [Actinomadura chibensis]TYB49800.1 DNA protection protein DPS [Actinomadura chibensis]
MSSVARELAERAGVDVDALIRELTSAARAKLSAHYRYTVLNASLAAVMGRDLREVLTDVRAEHHHHFDALVTRIYELDGRLPDDLVLFATAEPPNEPSLSDDPHALVTALLESARKDARHYTHLCELTQDKDHRTYDIVQAILFEQGEHESWFRELLGTGSPARFQRGFRGRSPYLSRLPPDAL